MTKTTVYIARMSVNNDTFYGIFKRSVYDIFRAAYVLVSVAIFQCLLGFLENFVLMADLYCFFFNFFTTFINYWQFTAWLSDICCMDTFIWRRLHVAAIRVYLWSFFIVKLLSHFYFSLYIWPLFVSWIFPKVSRHNRKHTLHVI